MEKTDKESRAKVNALRTKVNTAMQNYNSYYKTANLGKYGKGVQQLSTGVAKKVAIISGIAIVVIFVILCVTGVIPIGKAIRSAGSVKKAAQGDTGAINDLTNKVNEADKTTQIETTSPATNTQIATDPTINTNVSGANVSPARVLTQDEIQGYATRTIHGEFGNGVERTNAWTQEGISPEQQNQIQAIVNGKMPPKTNSQSIVSTANKTEGALQPAPAQTPIGAGDNPVKTAQTDTPTPDTTVQQEPAATTPSNTASTEENQFDAPGANCQLAVRVPKDRQIAHFMTNSIKWNDGTSIPAITTSSGITYTSIYDSAGQMHIYMYINGKIVDTQGRLVGADDSATRAITNIADMLARRG